MPPKRSVTRKKIIAEVKANDAARQRTGKNIHGNRSTPPTSQVRLKQMGYCGAKKKPKRNPDEPVANMYCMKKKGWGTDHPGIGACKYHGGNAATHRAAAERQRQIEFMGRPKEISPIDAIIWAIKVTAGEVEWLSSQIAEINDENKWIEFTITGQQMHVFQRARADAMDRLVRYSKDAIALGLAERAVRMAETFGASIARLLAGIYNDMDLTPAQKSVWPVIVRRHLILLEGGNPVTQADRAALPPGEKPIIDGKASKSRAA
jgi:hypothetical protein